MHRALHLCVLVFCASWTWAQQASTPSLNNARQLLAQGKPDQSLAELDTLSKQPSEPAGVERLRGFIFYQQNRFDQADAAFAKALLQDPKDMEAMQLRGVTLFRMGKAADAIPLLEQARVSVPNANIDPNYVLGVSYMQVGRSDDARHAFAAQYDFAPDSATAYLLAARISFYHDDIDAARASAAKAVQLDASLPLAHQLLGEIALATGDISGAIAELEKEAKVNPLNPQLYDRLGDAYLRNERFAEAQHALNRAVLLESNTTGPYILLGKLMLKQQNPMMAEMYLQHALKMDPGNHMTHYLLGQVYRTEGRRDDAAREYRAAEQIQSSTRPKVEEPH